jgi:cardiolipin synthase
MVRFDSSLLNGFLKRDFYATWRGHHTYAQLDAGTFGFYLLDGRSNQTGFKILFDAIACAKHSIVIESPYLSFPFYEKLRMAMARGVEVTLITPGQNNSLAFRYYTLFEAGRGGIRLKRYMPGMTHAKYMLVDGAELFCGTSNFDYLSYTREQEVIVRITDPGFITEFERLVIEPDLLRTEPVLPMASGWAAAACYSGGRFVGKVGSILALGRC